MSSLVVFSDVDGTLLDRDSYSFEPALPALAALRARGVPLVLCSSKTRSEMEVLATRLALDAPFVVENGGAVVFPEAGRGFGGGPCVVALGVSRGRLLPALPELAREAGVELLSFSAMSAPEVAALTGLGLEEAERAQQREYDEPFLVKGAAGRDPALDLRLDEAARLLGLRVVHGGRLHHLCGPCDKGSAVRLLLRRYRGAGPASVGLGDAANDLPLLRAVERPIVIPGPAGAVEATLQAALPAAERAPWPGPAGWNAALLAVLDGGALPRVAA